MLAIFGFAVLIILHELGHFAAAKAVDPTLSIRFDAVADGTSKVMKKPRRVMIIERVAVAAEASVAA